MKKENKPNGFSLIEAMLAVALLSILAGLSFVGVNNYLRGLTQLELDGIAKEIFIAAQNHLSVAESQSFLGLNPTLNGDAFGTKDDSTTPVLAGVYYYVVPVDALNNPGTVLDQILPFGALDETVRAGGSYVIRYQVEPAQVLDVFYVQQSGRFSFSFDTSFKNNSDKYKKLMSEYRDIGLNSKKNARKNSAFEGAVLGYYGAVDAVEVEKGPTLEKPIIRIENGDQLKVVIKDPNATALAAGRAEVKLIIRGESSKNQKGIVILEEGTASATSDFNVVLDDVTNNLFNESRTAVNATGATGHFCLLDNGFWPGEDITVECKISFPTKFAKPVTSGQTSPENSLFASVKTEIIDNTTYKVAEISSFRHLENLDANISNLDHTKIGINKARQIEDLDWKNYFVDKTDMGITKGDGAVCTTGRKYMPISPVYAMSYSGEKKMISNVDIGVVPEAGLFGKISAVTEISDLQLVDFNVSATVINDEGGNAGALCGTISDCIVKNVVAYNKDRDSSDQVEGSENAGGLIGIMNRGSITGSSAALYVISSDGNAGGLVGKLVGNGASGAEISGCYSGGHTKNSTTNYNETYSSTTTGDKRLNVIGKAAGGLVGYAQNADIKNSYSTCSASGNKVGGFIGYIEGTGSVENCYVTGLIKESGVDYYRGAFAGMVGNSVSFSDCQFFEIINEDRTTHTYLKAIGAKNALNGAEMANISAFDENIEKYNQLYIGKAKSHPYDSTLYSGSEPMLYPMKSIFQMDRSFAGCFVKEHYGDWPTPEIFVINTPAS